MERELEGPLLLPCPGAPATSRSAGSVCWKATTFYTWQLLLTAALLLPACTTHVQSPIEYLAAYPVCGLCYFHSHPRAVGAQ